MAKREVSEELLGHGWSVFYVGTTDIKWELGEDAYARLKDAGLLDGAVEAMAAAALGVFERHAAEIDSEIASNARAVAYVNEFELPAA